MSTEKINIALIGAPEAVQAATDSMRNFAQQNNLGSSFVLQDFLFNEVLVSVKAFTDTDLNFETKQFDGVIYAVIREEHPEPQETFTKIGDIKLHVGKSKWIMTPLKNNPYRQLANKMVSSQDTIQTLNLYRPTSTNNLLL